MKKILLGALLSASLCLLFAQESAAPSQAQIKFVKGNVSDKIAAVKSSGEGALAKKAVDFVVENAPLLKDDRDLAGLAVAGILSYPAEEYKKNPKQVDGRESVKGQYRGPHNFHGGKVTTLFAKLTHFSSLQPGQTGVKTT